MFDDDDFIGRRTALDALCDLCGREGILEPDGDAVVAHSFGRAVQPQDIDLLWEGVLAGRSAVDPKSLEDGVPDAVRGVVRRVAGQVLMDWDKKVGADFKTEMDKAYATPNPDILRLLAEDGVTGRKANKEARQLEAMLALRPEAKRAAILGLSVRAGVVSSADLDAAVEQEDVVKLAALTDRAVSLYNGTLDGYLGAYAVYHAYTALLRPTVGHNDALDLEVLLYLSASDSEQEYVTGEDLWLTVVDLAFAGRALNVREVAAARDGGRQTETSR